MRKIDKIGDNVLLYFGDCLEEMNKIPDKSVDMILCDLPYGTTSCEWDVPINLDDLWIQYKRIIRPLGAVVLFGNQPFTTSLINSNKEWFKYCWVWDKHIPRGFQVAKYRPMSRHEDILVFGNGKVNYYPIMIKRDKPVTVKNYSKNGSVSTSYVKYNEEGKSYTYTHRNPDTIIQGYWEANSKKMHPSQKPSSLMEYLVKTYTLEGFTVLDNCMGSGSTGVACVNTNRRFIGIELDENYYHISKKRIEEALHIVCE